MAGDWIKMRCDLRDDPAVTAVADRLEVDEDLVVGKLHRLWSWADQQTADGLLAGIAVGTIDRRLACPGLGAALVDVGWLVVEAGGVRIPRFDKHNGRTAKARAEHARVVAGSRRRTKQSAAGHAPGHKSVTPLSPTQSPNTSHPGHTPVTVTSEPEETPPSSPEVAAAPLPEAPAKARKPSRPPPLRAEDVTLPPALDTACGREALGRWLAYRQALPGKPKLTCVRSLATVLEDLAPAGDREFARTVDHSIAAGWQGLFPARPTGPPTSARSSRSVVDAARFVPDRPPTNDWES